VSWAINGFSRRFPERPVQLITALARSVVPLERPTMAWSSRTSTLMIVPAQAVDANAPVALRADRSAYLVDDDAPCLAELYRAVGQDRRGQRRGTGGGVPERYSAVPGPGVDHLLGTPAEGGHDVSHGQSGAHEQYRTVPGHLPQRVGYPRVRQVQVRASQLGGYHPVVGVAGPEGQYRVVDQPRRQPVQTQQQALVVFGQRYRPGGEHGEPHLGQLADGAEHVGQVGPVVRARHRSRRWRRGDGGRGANARSAPARRPTRSSDRRAR
jgi:hypothetical protein